MKSSLLNPRRVLVVDDDVHCLEFLKHRLKAGGYETLLAGDVVGARRHLEGEDIAAVLLDVRLPGQSGMELLRSAQALPPVIVMSAHIERFRDQAEACPSVVAAFDKHVLFQGELINFLDRMLGLAS